jgi:hypothetical protein
MKQKEGFVERRIVELEPVAVRRGTASRMLDCSPSTINKLIKSGRLKTVQVQTDLRITVESIRALAKQEGA